MVNHFIPTSLKEALTILNEHDCYIMNGGTDLMVQKHNVSQTLPKFDKDVLYIANLEELNYVKKDSMGVHIGSTCVMSDLMENSDVPPILRQVLGEIASPALRNVATIAGNISNASPAGDSIVPLYVLDARVVLVSVHGERTIKLNEYIKGVRKITREPNELVKEILIPNNTLQHFYWKKVGSRKAETISKVSMCGAYSIAQGRLTDLRIAFGAVSITILRNIEIENKFIGRKIEEINIDDIVDEYRLIVNPIDDVRSTAKYRHIVAMNMLKDFLTKMKEGGCVAKE